MTNIARHILIEELSAATLANYLSSENCLADTSDLSDAEIEGCLLIKRPPRTVPLESAVSIDFWRFRVSEIDERELPTDIGTVVVWDDLFSSANLQADIGKIIQSGSEWCSLPIDACAYGLHLRGLSTLTDALLRIARVSRKNGSTRIAIVDVDSCGPTQFGWPDILPAVRETYDLVVGFAHSFGQSMGDWSRFCEEPLHEDIALSSAIAHCDIAFLVSDGLLGFDSLTTEQRRVPLNNLFNDLLRTIMLTSTLLGLCGKDRPTVFCVGPSRSIKKQAMLEIDNQASIICDDFTEGVIPHRYNGASPIILDRVILWPLDEGSDAPEIRDSSREIL